MDVISTRVLTVHRKIKTMTAAVLPGRYRHYKGKNYIVIGVARHSETDEELVVYRLDYGDRSLWVRPAGMFVEQVLIDGVTVPRFQYVGPEQ